MKVLAIISIQFVQLEIKQIKYSIFEKLFVNISTKMTVHKKVNHKQDILFFYNKAQTEAVRNNQLTSFQKFIEKEIFYLEAVWRKTHECEPMRLDYNTLRAIHHWGKTKGNDEKLKIVHEKFKEEMNEEYKKFPYYCYFRIDEYDFVEKEAIIWFIKKIVPDFFCDQYIYSSNLFKWYRFQFKTREELYKLIKDRSNSKPLEVGEEVPLIFDVILPKFEMTSPFEQN
jgi:hypothetical protein